MYPSESFKEREIFEVRYFRRILRNPLTMNPPNWNGWVTFLCLTEGLKRRKNIAQISSHFSLSSSVDSWYLSEGWASPTGPTWCTLKGRLQYGVRYLKRQFTIMVTCPHDGRHWRDRIPVRWKSSGTRIQLSSMGSAITAFARDRIPPDCAHM